MLVGRAQEQAVIGDLIGRARAGTSSTVVLIGDVGIGKTSLLDHAAETADGCLVLRACGLAGERDLSYVVLADLIAPLLDDLPSLPPRQAAVLEGALALGPPTGADRFAVAVAVHSLLSVAAERLPLAVLVDDCQWVDPSSLDCLAFAVRRLEADPVALVFAVRSGEQAGPALAALEGVPRLDVGPLAEADAALLVARSAPDASRVRIEETAERAQGNPLALIELAGSPVLSPVQPASIGERLAAAFADELDAMPERTREALDVVAVMGDPRPGPVLALLLSLGIDPASLEPAEDAGILRASPGRLAFRHPLMQSVSYQRVPAARRRHLHQAVARWLGDQSGGGDAERRVWHATAGALGPDESLARELELLSEGASARSSAATAVRLLEQAADMSESPRARTLRLVRAADTAQAAGLLGDASQLLDRALADPGDADLVVPARYLRCRIDMWRGLPVEGRDALRELAHTQAHVAPREAAEMYAAAALTSIFLGEANAALECMDRATALVDRPSLTAVEAIDALVALVTGHGARGTRSLEGALKVLDPAAALSTHQEPLIVALALYARGDVPAALAEVERTIRAVREASALGLLPFQLSRLSFIQMTAGHWSGALSSAHEGLDLARQTGWHTEVPMALAALARVEGGMGREDDCRAHAHELLEIGRFVGLGVLSAYASSALGLLALGRGDVADAASHLEQVRDFATGHGLVDNPLLPWATDLADAYAMAGEPDAAEEILSGLDGEDERPGALARTAAVERVRGRLAGDPDEAAEHLARSVVLAGRAGAPFEQGRSLLAQGQLRRRSRQPRLARQPLAAALAHFEQLGAHPWSEQARTELRASGTPVESKSPDLAQLTAQELTVARAVAQGWSNKQAAERLFLSVRTVEFHLSSTYRKLGINRRAQLVRHFPDPD